RSVPLQWPPRWRIRRKMNYESSLFSFFNTAGPGDTVVVRRSRMASNRAHHSPHHAKGWTRGVGLRKLVVFFRRRRLPARAPSERRADIRTHRPSDPPTHPPTDPQTHRPTDTPPN